MGILTYEGRQFYLDGRPFTVLSGAMHYFRIPRAYWHDRLLKLKECGLNTVETYTAWSLHEPKEGTFDFSGNLDLAAYIEEAAALGLNVILRPGPFICAETDFGGLPAWLLRDKAMELRCDDESYLAKVRAYFKELFAVIRPYLAKNGGPVFMMQVENEYGSYGNDKVYLSKLMDIYRENGMDTLLFAADGASQVYLTGGHIDGCMSVATLGSRVKAQMSVLADLYRDQPLMCGEYWSGWFDHWFGNHNVRPPEQLVNDVRDFLDMDASFNIYMFHGGTNFGFTNGANYAESYSPTVTSYDYNAPLSEAGDRTPGYYAVRSLIEEKYGKLSPMTASETKKACYGDVRITEYAPLFENLDRLCQPITAPKPAYMEDLGQCFGYTLYRATLTGPREDYWKLSIGTVNDRAQIFVNGEPRAIFTRWEPEKQTEADVHIPLAEGEEATLDILCENMGRVNYGPHLTDRKGIRDVRFYDQWMCGPFHFGFTMYPLEMNNLDKLVFRPIEGGVIPSKTPTFFRATLAVTDEPADTFVRLDGFGKGFVTVNGHNLGRYFNSAGPQKTLYLPAPFLKKGENEIIIFESDGETADFISLLDTPDLG